MENLETMNKIKINIEEDYITFSDDEFLLIKKYNELSEELKRLVRNEFYQYLCDNDVTVDDYNNNLTDGVFGECINNWSNNYINDNNMGELIIDLFSAHQLIRDYNDCLDVDIDTEVSDKMLIELLKLTLK